MAAVCDLSRRVKLTPLIVHLTLVLIVQCQLGYLDHKTVFTLGDDRSEQAQYAYSHLADLNIGGLFTIHEFSKTEPCGPDLRETGIVQLIEAMVYAINQVNRSPLILPNVSLGFVILDDCMKPTTALAQTLHFMPLNTRPSDRCERNCYHQSHTFYDVIGVIGAESSPSSIMMANLLGIFEIPQLSPTSTSDLLSDKNKYPYFMRMIPPNQFQVKAILHLLQHFNWTHVSAIYTKGGYGEDAVEDLELLARKNGVCIGTTLAVKKNQDLKSLSKLIWDLYSTHARVVVLFIDQEEARDILSAVQRVGLLGYFVWVGSDGIGVNMDDFDGVEDAIVGALTLRAYSIEVPAFDKYFTSLTPHTTINPWFKSMWADLFGCSWNPKPGGKKRKCPIMGNITNTHDYQHEVYVSLIIDAVYTFALSLDKLIKENCSKVRKVQIRDCVKKANLLSYMKNISFSGLTGNINFDVNGDMLGRYEILNYQRNEKGIYKPISVGVWDSLTSKLDIDVQSVVWNIKDSNKTIPESSCGQQCDREAIYVYYKDTCCWECRQCNSNEITVDNNTRCKTCPMFTWPDQQTFTQCNVIKPDFMRWHEPLVLILISLSLSGICFSSIIFVVFARNNDARIIKATSRELSYIMLGGLTIQYMLVFTFVSKPETFVCYFNYIGFNMSFTVVYGPLLTRTTRIYRIFHIGRKTKVMPSFTSPISQVFITLSLISTQVGTYLNILARTF